MAVRVALPLGMRISSWNWFDSNTWHLLFVVFFRLSEDVGQVGDLGHQRGELVFELLALQATPQAGRNHSIERGPAGLAFSTVRFIAISRHAYGR